MLSIINGFVDHDTLVTVTVSIYLCGCRIEASLVGIFSHALMSELCYSPRLKDRMFVLFSNLVTNVAPSSPTTLLTFTVFNPALLD